MIENFKNTKGRGQNFLIDDNIVNQIINVVPRGKIIEIGPGAGGITDRLFENRELTLIEIDEELVTHLTKKYVDKTNLTIIQSDATKYDYRVFNNNALNIVGNLPYSVANRIIRNIGYHNSVINSCIFMTQKEPAQKLIGDDKSGYGSLRTFINTFFTLELLFDVPPTAFKPKPKIVSTVFSMKRNSQESISVEAAENYFSFLEVLYQRKRKTVLNNLEKYDKTIVREILSSLELKDNCRPDELTASEIYSIFRRIENE